MQGLRGPWHPGLDHTGSLGVATGNPRWIFGAHAADLRVQLLRCSLTHAGCARSAARSFTRISTTWTAESLAEGFRPSLNYRRDELGWAHFGCSTTTSRRRRPALIAALPTEA